MNTRPARLIVLCLTATSPLSALSGGLVSTATNIQQTLYAVVIPLATIALILAGVNWKFEWVGHDPKKTFVNTCIGSLIALSAPKLVTWLSGI